MIKTFSIETCTQNLREAERVRNAKDMKLWHRRLSDAVKAAEVPSVEEALKRFRAICDRREPGDIVAAYETLKQSVRAEEPGPDQMPVAPDEIAKFFGSALEMHE